MTTDRRPTTRIGGLDLPTQFRAEFPSTQLLWHGKLGGKFDLAVAIELIDGRYECVALEVRHVEGGQPISNEELRGIPVAGLVISAAFAAIHSVPGGKELVPLNTEPEPWAPDPRWVEGGPTDEALRHLSQWYELAYALNIPPRRHVEAMAGISRASAARWIAKARAKGYLKETDRGEH